MNVACQHMSVYQYEIVTGIASNSLTCVTNMNKCHSVVSVGVSVYVRIAAR